jgi:serine/threonine protein kinase
MNSQIRGTLEYMAPEILNTNERLRAYDAKADVWSVGCVLYMLLSGMYAIYCCTVPQFTAAQYAIYCCHLPLTLTLVCQESCRFGVPGAISRTMSSTNASSTLLRRGPFPQKQVPRQRLLRQYLYVCTSEASKLRTSEHPKTVTRLIFL